MPFTCQVCPMITDQAGYGAPQETWVCFNKEMLVEKKREQCNVTLDTVVTKAALTAKFQTICFKITFFINGLSFLLSL